MTAVTFSISNMNEGPDRDSPDTTAAAVVLVFVLLYQIKKIVSLD